MRHTWSGDSIRARRESLGLSQATVADRAGLNKEVYRRYETGEREPGITVARTIAEILDLSLAEISGQVPEHGAATAKVNSPSVVGAVIEGRRNELGLSQTQVAATAGLQVETYQEYERGDTELPLTTAAVLADVLDISLAKLAGTEHTTADLGGPWHTCWQSHTGDDASTHTVDALRVTNKLALDQGWRGELEIFGDEVLIGWYRPPTRGIRTRMGVFLWISTGAEYLYGRWTGVADNNSVVSGWCVLARDPQKSREVLGELVDTNRPQAGPNLRLPRLGGWGSGG